MAMMASTTTSLVLDWNGTLLNDVQLALDGVNRVRGASAMRPISLNDYRESFELPIKHFYAKVGLADSCEHFNAAMSSYLEFYTPRAAMCALHHNVREMLCRLKGQGFRLAVLSASAQQDLTSAIRAHGLCDFFDITMGKSDSSADSKLSEAKALSDLLGEPSSRVFYIGDTQHDADIAECVGWRCALVEDGHQSPIRFHKQVHRLSSVSSLLGFLHASGVIK